MITIKDKLEIFNKLIYEEEEEKYRKALEELESRNKEILEKKKLELKNKREEELKRKKLLEERQKNNIVSQKSQEIKSKLLSKRKEILEDLIDSLEEKANSYTFTDEYKVTLVKEISKLVETINDREIIITITEDDKPKIEDDILKIADRYNKKIYISTVKKSILIGGFILSDTEKTYAIDNSYKTIIEENRYEIGKRLYRALEEAGDFKWTI